MFSKEVHLIFIINHLFLFLTLIHVCTLSVMVNALTVVPLQPRFYAFSIEVH